MFDDIRYGFRLMARTPGITAIAILVLALGIGINSAMYSVVNAVLLRPLPLKDSERIVWIWATNPVRNLPIAFTQYAVFGDWQRQAQSFEMMSAYTPASMNLTTGAEPERIAVMRVNSNYLDVFGVKPFVGRNFLSEEDQPNAPGVAILDYKLWQRRFGSDPNIAGKPVVLDGAPVTVVGVLPEGLQIPGSQADAYMPIARSTARGSGNEQVSVGAFGRLKRGVALERAQAEMDTISAGLVQAFPQTKGFGARLWRAHDFMVREVRVTVMVLMVAVGLVLLIACANVANLLLARAGARQREVGVRVALGARRGRIVRQLLTESTMLSLTGGALGILFAWWAVRFAVTSGPAGFPLLRNAKLDPAALALTATLSILTGILFGLAPAFAAIRADVQDSLREGGRGGGEGISRNRFRSALVVTEVALALLLMVGASLLMRSLLRLQQADPGFAADGVLTASVTLPPASYRAPEQRIAFFRDLLDRLQSTPGVESAGMTSLLPFTSRNSGQGLLIRGQAPPRPGEVPILYFRSVDARYFRAMRIPLKQGRLFDDRDDGKIRVAVINETMARRFWPKQDPVGKQFGNGRDWITVVGVVGDVKHMGFRLDSEPEYFEPFPQSPRLDMVLTVRTTADPLRFAPALRQTVREVNKDLPVSQVASMSQRLSDSIAPSRFATVLLGIFAAAALLLAAVGVYGVISYSVSRRTHEIGIRTALGAQKRAVIAMVVRQALVLAGCGVALGLAGSFALTRLLKTMLYQVSATDLSVFAGVPVILLTVALFASYVPARRAAKIDAIVALRYE